MQRSFEEIVSPCSTINSLKFQCTRTCVWKSSTRLFVIREAPVPTGSSTISFSTISPWWVSSFGLYIISIFASITYQSPNMLSHLWHPNEVYDASTVLLYLFLTCPRLKLRLILV